MSHDLLSILFPRASRDFREANSDLFPTKVEPPSEKQIVLLPKDPMNQTEREYSFILEAMKRRGEILRYDFEGVTLRWADMKYTPDFVVITGLKEMFFTLGVKSLDVERFGSNWLTIKLIEVKGAHIWDRDIVRFKGAKGYWPQFSFEMHQKTKQGWKRIN